MEKKSAEMESAAILKLSFEMLPYYILSFSLCIYKLVTLQNV